MVIVRWRPGEIERGCSATQYIEYNPYIAQYLVLLFARFCYYLI